MIYRVVQQDLTIRLCLIQLNFLHEASDTTHSNFVSWLWELIRVPDMLHGGCEEEMNFGRAKGGGGGGGSALLSPSLSFYPNRPNSATSLPPSSSLSSFYSHGTGRERRRRRTGLSGKACSLWEGRQGRATTSAG